MVKDETNATTENPVPSITLSITQDDVKRVLDASEAMAETLALIQKRNDDDSDIDAVTQGDKSTENGQTLSKRDHASNPLRIVSTSDASSTCSTEEETSKPLNKKTKRPLHEMIFEAAQQCEHPMLQAFLEKMKASGSTSKEVRAGILVFHDLDMPAKFKLIFDVLGEESSKGASSDNDKENNEMTLSRDGALSLFRSVIVAISSCIHRDNRVQIEMEKHTAEPPTKKRKLETCSPEPGKTQENSPGSDSIPALESSPSRSFDSSLATLKEEDDFTTSAVRKEFEEIAMYATDRLVRFTQKGASSKSDGVAISFTTFDEWRALEGAKIAPWLELLNLAKWKTPQRPANRPQVAVKKPEEEAEKDAQPEEKVKEEPKSPERKSPPKTTPMKEAKKKAASSEKAVLSPMFQDDNSSRTVVSFDFTGSMPDADSESVFCINITEDNLSTLHNLVRNTGLASRPISEITDILLGASKSRDNTNGEMKVIPIERFHTCLHQLLGSGSSRRLSKVDKDVFSSSFVDFFSCFDTREAPLEAGEANAKELAVGFCFLCAGNKSAKLATGFEMLESEKSIGLSTGELAQYLRSYLTMLCGISLLTSSSDGVMKPKLNNARRKAMFSAVENGARWTLSHFLKTTGSSKESIHSFEAFASWYTAGGFNVAPWLELLDLKKLLSLVGDASEIGPKSPPITQDSLPPFPEPKSSTPEAFVSPRRSHHTPPPDPYAHPPAPPPAEVMFTFPLANQRSLVVLKEDASYVRKVVDQLGLLSLAPDEIWSSLHSIALKHPPVPPHHGAKAPKNGLAGKSMPVNKATFVECMQETIQSKTSSRKRSSSGVSKSASGARDVLVNFFHSFDLLQVDRVALNELMGGLTLLCGGKKSTKLAFAFGVFDQRPPPKTKRGKKSSHAVNSLGGEDLFLFLRSFLIVMFSCCRQSWDLSDDAVNRYIADTANMVTDDVMRYQWRTRKKDRVDFDEFGQWYNEGGFETAPWLELLDLKKWVLVESFDALDTHRPPPASPGVASTSHLSPRSDVDCPPAPPDDSVDPSFFDDDPNAIMPMDSIDEMDILLMQPSQDKENDADLNKLSRSFSYSPNSPTAKSPKAPSKSSNALKFHLVTEDDHGGTVVSVSQKRIQHLRHILLESGLCKLDAEIACKQILGKAYRDDKTGRYCMAKEDFDSAMRGLIASRNMSVDTQRTLSAILGELFTAFDYAGTGIVNAVEVACGFTVFCKGKKSDKLEYAFEVLDRERRGNLSQSDTAKYLRSFLTVLLNIVSTDLLDSDYNEDVMTTTSGRRCERTTSTVARAVEAGSSWAAAQAFKNRRASRDLICFDEFAEWYTQVGYSNIPWLELLDLHKWVITDV
jgi:Ca2+-binding EF-hand superfamily protein